MNQRKSEHENLGESRPVISSRTQSIVKTISSDIKLQENDIRPLSLEQLVEEEGVEGAIHRARALATNTRWEGVAVKLRSMLHRLQNGKMSF